MYRFAYHVINKTDERKHELILIKYLLSEKCKTRAESLIKANPIKRYKDKDVYMVGIDEKNNIAISSVQDCYNRYDGLAHRFLDEENFERIEK